MRVIIAIFLISLGITAAGTPWLIRAAERLGFVDRPSERKLHATPKPLLGGLAILMGAVLALVLLVPDLPQHVVGAILAALVVAFVGLWDDRYGLPVWVKLAGQTLAVAILVYAGVRVRLPVPDVVNYAITFLWVVGITNAINFLDNMDGLSAGICGVAASFILLLASFQGQFLVGAMAAAILGACLGFLRFNFYPAQIFMGDAGSLFLGFLLAVLGIQLRFPENVNFVTWMVPVLILGLPIFDMTLVVISRLRRGISPTTAGRDHVSHRLLRLGFSVRETVLTLYLVGGVLGMLALFVTQATIMEGYSLAAIAAVLALLAVWKLEQIYERQPERQS